MEHEDIDPEGAADAAHAAGEDQAQAIADAQQTAREALALTMLKDRVTDAIGERRETVAGQWTPGSKQAIVLPNPLNPKKPLKVGEVRCDNGAVVVRVADDDAWTRWVAEHHPAEVIDQAPSETAWQLDDASRSALFEAMIASRDGAITSLNAGGFGGEPYDAEAAFLAELERHGYTLVPVERIPGRRQVSRTYEDEVLRRSKEVETPLTPDGEIPEGITVDTADPRTVIVPTKDELLRERFIAEARRTMPELMGGTTDATVE